MKWYPDIMLVNFGSHIYNHTYFIDGEVKALKDGFPMGIESVNPGCLGTL